MKTKYAKSIALIIFVALCVFVLRFISGEKDQLTTAAKKPVIEKEQVSTEPLEKSHTAIYYNRDMVENKKNDPINNQNDGEIFEDRAELPQKPDPAVNLSRDNFPVEEADYVEDPRFVDSVDVLEVELAGLLSGYEMSDDKIDRIMKKIRRTPDSIMEDTDPPDDYLKRLQTIVRLVDQSDVSAEQLSMIINDIFPE